MQYSIGKQLGLILAHFEYDLTQDPDDVEALQKIGLISESYKNFVAAELGNFKSDFDQGYEIGSTDIRKKEEAQLEGKELSAEMNKGLNLG